MTDESCLVHRKYSRDGCFLSDSVLEGKRGSHRKERKREGQVSVGTRLAIWMESLQKSASACMMTLEYRRCPSPLIPSFSLLVVLADGCVLMFLTPIYSLGQGSERASNRAI